MKWRTAWLHRANDNYYTDEQAAQPDFHLSRETLESCYLHFIEIAAYNAALAEVEKHQQVDYWAERGKAAEKERDQLRVENKDLKLWNSLSSASKIEHLQQLRAEQLAHLQLIDGQAEEIQRLRAALEDLTEAGKDFLCEISEPDFVDDRISWENRQVTRGSVDEFRKALETNGQD